LATTWLRSVRNVLILTRCSTPRPAAVSTSMTLRQACSHCARSLRARCHRVFRVPGADEQQPGDAGQVPAHAVAAGGRMDRCRIMAGDLSLCQIVSCSMNSSASLNHACPGVRNVELQVRDRPDSEHAEICQKRRE
jgi:hypothetical protein